MISVDQLENEKLLRIMDRDRANGLKRYKDLKYAYAQKLNCFRQLLVNKVKQAEDDWSDDLVESILNSFDGMFPEGR